MSKLSPTLKALISAPYARPNTLPAPPHIRSVYERLRQEASAKNVGTPAWLTLSTATTMTMNSPGGLTELYKLATEGEGGREEAVRTAELMREVGLKCIGFNGVPRTINCLGAFRASLPSEIASSLSTKPTRQTSPTNITSILTRGASLWKSIYHPYDTKLFAKLAASHPDLPTFIVDHEYGALFADPDARVPGARVGRVLTSVVA
ncbi:Dol-P-Man:Man(5)GlcNAc(2)-PP-Dol alpha-1,3-mannosyltransferase, partial [Lachnellula arida]